MANTFRLSESPCESHHSEGTASIDEGEWLIRIKQSLHAKHRFQRPPTPPIFSVPNILIDFNRDAYLPKVVSIGPSFHRNRQLSDMDCHKLSALQRVIKRIPGETSRDVNFIVAEIQKMDSQIRESYQKFIDCNSETLAWMMLLDASFLLELLRTLTGRDQFDSSDCMYFDEKKIKSVGFGALTDIVKLENQIPLFVMAKILEFETGSEKDAQTRLFHLLLNAASTFFPFKYLQPSRFEQDSPFTGRYHFLGFLHALTLYFFSGANSAAFSSSSTVESRSNQVLPSASRLSKAGMCIRPYVGDGGMALRFDKETSTLYIPVIMISENTETVVRNLMAMEMFLPTEFQVVSCYVGLMRSLIHTEHDATLLRMAGVFYIDVGNDAQVAQLWENLCKGMSISSLQPLKSFKEQIMECYKCRWRARLIEFFMIRFTGSWRTTISVLAATFVFLFTFTQTLSSMYGLYRANP